MRAVVCLSSKYADTVTDHEKVLKLENKLDQLIYEIYELTPEEKEQIETYFITC